MIVYSTIFHESRLLSLKQVREQQDFTISPFLGRLVESFVSIVINYPWLAVQGCYKNKPLEAPNHF